MSIISKVVGKTQGARRLPRTGLITDLRRRALLERPVTPAPEVSRDPCAMAEGVAHGVDRRNDRISRHARTKNFRRVQDWRVGLAVSQALYPA